MEVVPSEVKPESLIELQSKYVELVKQAGEKQYMKMVLEAEINNLNKQIYDLNVKSSALQSKQDSPEVEKAQG
jgi:hypothetical protein